jgi:hypothetical protein
MDLNVLHQPLGRIMLRVSAWGMVNMRVSTERAMAGVDLYRLETDGKIGNQPGSILDLSRSAAGSRSFRTGMRP